MIRFLNELICTSLISGVSFFPFFANSREKDCYNARTFSFLLALKIEYGFFDFHSAKIFREGF